MRSVAAPYQSLFTDIFISGCFYYIFLLLLFIILLFITFILFYLLYYLLFIIFFYYFYILLFDRLSFTVVDKMPISRIRNGISYIQMVNQKTSCCDIT